MEERFSDYLNLNKTTATIRENKPKKVIVTEDLNAKSTRWDQA